MRRRSRITRCRRKPRGEKARLAAPDTKTRVIFCAIPNGESAKSRSRWDFNPSRSSIGCSKSYPGNRPRNFAKSSFQRRRRSHLCVATERARRRKQNEQPHQCCHDHHHIYARIVKVFYANEQRGTDVPQSCTQPKRTANFPVTATE